MRQRAIPVEEVALAYELRTEGISWKRIGIVLGHHPIHLRDALAYVIRNGFRRA